MQYPQTFVDEHKQLIEQIIRRTIAPDILAARNRSYVRESDFNDVDGTFNGIIGSMAADRICKEIAAREPDALKGYSQGGLQRTVAQFVVDYLKQNYHGIHISEIRLDYGKDGSYVEDYYMSAIDDFDDFMDAYEELPWVGFNG